MTNILRNSVVFVVGCLGPIAAMVAVVQAIEHDIISHPRMWFGPLMLVLSVILGALSMLIAWAWPSPWGVVVEHRDNGHGELTACGSKDEAEALAQAVNQAVDNV